MRIETRVPVFLQSIYLRNMKQLLFIILFSPLISPCQNVKPAFVVLGVTHSAQLVNSGEQPAALRAFMNRVKPDAILIERSPEEFARDDYYEFTYEQQYVTIPFARQKKIPLFPFDWLPKEEDLLLAFRTKDLEVPAFTRNPSGFWGFSVFSDSSVLNRSLYYAEDSALKKENAAWYRAYPEKEVHADFARRLFLYRTFLQAKRIEMAAKHYSHNDTLLVVIGDLHKEDLERNLAGAGYNIISPARFGPVTKEEIKRNFEPNDAFAIASFNLLGVQARTKVTDNELLGEAIQHIKGVNSPEAQFFELKYLLHTKKIAPAEVIKRYGTLLQNLRKDARFTWTGVKHASRLDNYFDPFGNMTLWQRIHLELAREYYTVGDLQNYKKEKEILMGELQGLKKAMLISYWPAYIER